MTPKTKKTKAVKPTMKATTSKTTKMKKPSKVVPIVDALKVDCPKCKVTKGHRCIHTHSYKGQKRDNPHRARIQLALKKLAPSSTKKVKKAS